MPEMVQPTAPSRKHSVPPLGDTVNVPHTTATIAVSGGSLINGVVFGPGVDLLKHSLQISGKLLEVTRFFFGIDPDSVQV